MSLLVIRCPNGCFHNGDCVGATCFCYRGWTGRDCSQFHCNDVHNCSGNGRCVGPNVCKCLPGFLVGLKSKSSKYMSLDLVRFIRGTDFQFLALLYLGSNIVLIVHILARASHPETLSRR